MKDCFIATTSFVAEVTFKGINYFFPWNHLKIYGVLIKLLHLNSLTSSKELL